MRARGGQAFSFRKSGFGIHLYKRHSRCGESSELTKVLIRFWSLKSTGDSSMSSPYFDASSPDKWLHG